MGGRHSTPTLRVGLPPHGSIPKSTFLAALLIRGVAHELRATAQLGCAVGGFTPEPPSTGTVHHSWNLELRMYVVVLAALAHTEFHPKINHPRANARCGFVHTNRSRGGAARYGFRCTERRPARRLGQGKGRWSRASIDPYPSLSFGSTAASIPQSANEGCVDPLRGTTPPP